MERLATDAGLTANTHAVLGNMRRAVEQKQAELRRARAEEDAVRHLMLDVLEARQALDPEGRFLSPFVRRVLGLDTSETALG